MVTWLAHGTQTAYGGTSCISPLRRKSFSFEEASDGAVIGTEVVSAIETPSGTFCIIALRK